MLKIRKSQRLKRKEGTGPTSPTQDTWPGGFSAPTHSRTPYPPAWGSLVNVCRAEEAEYARAPWGGREGPDRLRLLSRVQAPVRVPTEHTPGDPQEQPGRQAGVTSVGEQHLLHPSLSPGSVGGGRRARAWQPLRASQEGEHPTPAPRAELGAGERTGGLLGKDSACLAMQEEGGWPEKGVGPK